VTNTESWDRIASQRREDPPTDVVRYAPDGPTEDDLRLLGNVAGKRVLDLGCGVGQATVTLARQGATVIGVDASNGMLERGRSLAERAEARIEWHHGDLADLAFLRAESIDLAFSAYSLGEVDDLGRVLRQVHRVLRNRAMFVFSFEHPIALCVGRAPPDSPSTPIDAIVRMSYFTDEPITVERDGESIKLHVRTVSDVFHALTRSGFRVEVLAEPRPAVDALIPRTIVWRARKEGI
jgi:ubiquinone/menaquinone biosynthesis C-methylase UbiE